MKAPAAMMTLLSYPGMSHGSGVTKESTGAPFCTPSQKAIRAFGSRRQMAWMMSARGSLLLGVTS